MDCGQNNAQRASSNESDFESDIPLAKLESVHQNTSSDEDNELLATLKALSQSDLSSEIGDYDSDRHPEFQLGGGGHKMPSVS